MPGQVIILGARGRFGRAAVTAFLEAGWRVRALARNWSGAPPAGRETRIEGNAFNTASLSAAVAGCDVIINAVNPPYPKWSREMPTLTKAVIAAAKQSGATVMVPGNVYNFGTAMPPRLDEDTPHRARHRKGKLRIAMERAYADAAKAGVRTIILRGGDFFEGVKSGNWFEDYIIAKIDQGKVMYPGPLDRVHAWAFLPDMARAMAGLAAERSRLAPFTQIGFPGYALTGRELIDGMERICGRSLRVNSMPWPLIRVLGLVMAQMREVAEMAYLWRVPHAIDGARLAEILPEFQPTPLRVALATALGVRDLRAAA
ncbi:NAD(P)H-binding protein [uncultured Maricaulis sp.]|uniref:NAD(P)H-binding protein n=1 Tax=uncultured Maricaulis sp. TaxID=174710 RepID=UPI0030DC6824|tara:strand:- start:52926 stop:53870 length:945 start_codon:yes stop_codon:yes gene_type:complete